MLSIIICSISEERLQAVKQNITETIGCEHEFIAIDNRQKKWPIAKVYNYGAQQAKYPYLFFVHEDIRIHSSSWGDFIEQKLKEKDCGAIGFAGSAIRLPQYAGWCQDWEHACVYYYQGYKDEPSELVVRNAQLGVPFQQVLVLDGMGFFVRKELWEQYPFDEHYLTGFHCYDIDFTLQLAAQQYKNYVCSSDRLLFEHFSHGNYSEYWYSSTIRLHREKWNRLLPLAVPGTEIPADKQKKMEEKILFNFLRDLLQTNCPEKRSVLKEFLRLPFSIKHLGHCFNCLTSYLFRYKQQNATHTLHPHLTKPHPNNKSGKATVF